MALTKTNSKKLVTLFHALSDETRLEIVRRLGSGEKCVCDLQDLLDAAQSRLSYHLKLLKDAGLVTDRREGRWVHYSLVPGALDTLGAFVGDLEAAAVISSANSCC
jgi:ArsR family transcriptional regulator, arsenate/arsenite/antimonite-responsive transcriptional repressor